MLRVFAMRKVMLFMAPMIPILSGCAGSVIFGHTIGQGRPASTVQPSAPESLPPAQAPAPALLKANAAVKLMSATMTFTPDAKQKIDADPRFSGEALLAAVNADLRSHDLIDDGGDAREERTIEIVIEDFVTRPASNVQLFGYVFSNGTLAGNIELRDATGRELGRYNIKADSRLAASANDGEQTQPLRSLYRRFADLTVSKLTGVPIESPDSQMPR